MRMVIHFSLPLEPFNSYVRDGTAGERIGRVLEDLQPEAVYFTAKDGSRGGIMILDIESASDIPSIAEPFFLMFEADVSFDICMSPDDLAAAGLEELAEKWG